MARRTGKRPIEIIGLPREPTPREIDAALKSAGIKGRTFTPVQLHGFILKLVLTKRITDQEVKLITETFRILATQYWG